MRGFCVEDVKRCRTYGRRTYRRDRSSSPTPLGEKARTSGRRPGGGGEPVDGALNLGGRMSDAALEAGELTQGRAVIVHPDLVTRDGELVERLREESLCGVQHPGDVGVHAGEPSRASEAPAAPARAATGAS